MSQAGFGIDLSNYRSNSNGGGNGPSGGVLTIMGSQQADTISFSITAENMLRVIAEIDGEQTTKDYNQSEVTKLRVIAKGGDDVVTNLTAIAGEFYGGGGSDRLLGGSNQDELYGDYGRDFIFGGDANDKLFGGHGRDLLHGGKGNDTIRGQIGDDKLFGGDGGDKLYGGFGNDELDGQTGNDIAYGGMHDDTLHEVFGVDQSFGEEGNNVIRTTYQVGNDSDISDGLYNGNQLSFREAAMLADDDDIVEFSRLTKLGAAEIRIINGSIRLNNDITIQGANDRSQVVFQGEDQVNRKRLFSIEGGANVELSSLSIEGFSALSRGAVANVRRGKLVLRDVLARHNATKREGGAFFTSANGNMQVVEGSMLRDNSILPESDADSGTGDGGAIYNLGVLTIDRSTIKSNHASSLGGGIFNSGGVVEINASTIRGNTTDFRGGAIYNSAGVLKIVASTISENEAKFHAGAILIDPDSDAEILGSTIKGNRAGFRAGAINSRGSTLKIVDSTILENRSGVNGGGLYINHGHLEVVRSTIRNNYTELVGGGIYIHNGDTVDIVSSSIRDNEANGHGGGIGGVGGVVTIASSTISGNRAITGEAGGIDAGFDLRIVNSTIAHNQSYFGGAGIDHNSGVRYRVDIHNTTIAYNRGETADSAGIDLHEVVYATFNNTIVFGNQAEDEIKDFLVPNFVDYDNSYGNLIGEENGGGFEDGENGNIVGVVDAGLAKKLASNGGFTKSLRLRTGSLAIGAGRNEKAVDFDGQPLANDQRGAGFDRIAGASVDIGAYEYQA